MHVELQVPHAAQGKELKVFPKTKKVQFKSWPRPGEDGRDLG